MQLNAPKQIVCLISLILVVVSIVASFVTIPFISLYAWWILLAGYVVLLLGVILKDF